MKEVNVDLYDFLNKHETGMYYDYKIKEVRAYVFIPFDDLDKFINIVGNSYFNEGGYDCKLQEREICIELNEFIDGDGHLLSSYKNCFDNYNWEEYKEKIKLMEKTYK